MGIMDELTYRRIFEGARGPGKTNESLVKLGEALMRGERVQWVGRAAGLSNVVWDEMGMYPGTWQWVDEQGGIHDVGIDWGKSLGYSVVTRIGPGKITFERIEHERPNQMHAARLERQPDRDRPRFSAVRGSPPTRELQLHRRGSDIPELLRGIRGG